MVVSKSLETTNGYVIEADVTFIISFKIASNDNVSLFSLAAILPSCFPPRKSIILPPLQGKVFFLHLSRGTQFTLGVY